MQYLSNEILTHVNQNAVYLYTVLFIGNIYLNGQAVCLHDVVPYNSFGLKSVTRSWWMKCLRLRDLPVANHTYLSGLGASSKCQCLATSEAGFQSYVMYSCILMKRNLWISILNLKYTCQLLRKSIGYFQTKRVLSIPCLHAFNAMHSLCEAYLLGLSRASREPLKKLSDVARAKSQTLVSILKLNLNL